MTTMPEAAANDNSEAPDPVDEVTAAVRRAVKARLGAEANFAEREAAALEVTNEATRRLLVSDLKVIVAGQGQQDLLIDDRLFRIHHEGSATYYSLVGPLPVARPTYREVGVRNGPTVVPLELAAGLMEGATPALAQRVALGYAKHHSRGLEEDLRASRRSPPSRTRLEKLGKRLGARTKQRVARIEALLRQAEQAPEGAAGISVGLDRTAVPMEEQRPAEQPPKTRRKKRVKPYQRKPPPPVDVNYHMAYVGTVSLTDADGEVLVSRRYAASHEEGPDGIIRRMMADVRNGLRREPALTVGVTQDGAPELWNLLRPALENQAGVAVWLEAIDRYHLDERLAKVLRVLEPDPTARKRRLHDWNEELDRDDATIDRIERLIGQVKDRHAGEAYCVLHDTETFLRNNKDRMRYVALRKAGLPVGSGVTEGSCRWVIGERTKRASRRWHPDGLDAALALRSIYCSDRLPGFLKRLQRTYTADIHEAA